MPLSVAVYYARTGSVSDYSLFVSPPTLVETILLNSTPKQHCNCFCYRGLRHIQALKMQNHVYFMFISMLLSCSLIIPTLHSATGELRYSFSEEMKKGSVVGNIARDLGLDSSRLAARKAHKGTPRRTESNNVTLTWIMGIWLLQTGLIENRFAEKNLPAFCNWNLFWKTHWNSNALVFMYRILMTTPRNFKRTLQKWRYTNRLTKELTFPYTKSTMLTSVRMPLRASLLFTK